MPFAACLYNIFKEKARAIGPLRDQLTSLNIYDNKELPDTNRTFPPEIIVPQGVRFRGEE